MSSFLFLYPQWLIATLPWMGLIYWLTRRNRSQTLIAPHLAKAMGLQVTQTSKIALNLMAVCGLITIVALAGPSFSKQERPSFVNTSARVVVMDMSMSMYATDIKPNRLTQAKYKVSDLLENWQEGSTGLVAYAGDAYRISPMTSDSLTIANQVPNLSPELMPYPGANAAAGVELAIQMMTNIGLAQGNIVLVADDIDDQERDDIQSLLSGTNWQLVLLGMGSRSGAPIKLSDGTLMTKASGQPVVAKSNFDNMRALASSLDGYFVPVQITNSDVEKITQLTSHIDSTGNMNKDQSVTEQINQGYWLLPLLIVPALLLFRRGILFSVALIFIPLLSPKPAMATPWLNQDQQAMQYFENKEYDKAAEQFSQQEWKGIAQYQAQNYEGAIKSLKGATSQEGRYNLANAYAQNGQLDEAENLYQSILNQDPSNQDAKHNLEVVRQAQ
ncbi:VWA domain-containing protein, partial [Vibrio bivalvicida]